MPRTTRAALGALTLALLATSPAAAQQVGDPIMPLSRVQPGMRCTGLSVIRGTEISSFDVEIVDIIRGDEADRAPRLLIRVSGPAIDGTGIGPGFSGSPIYCTSEHGESLNAGAVSEGIGEYGNRLALATPVEQIIGEYVDPPAGVRYAPRTMRRAQPLAAPLVFSGVSGRVATALRKAGEKLGRVVYAAPAAPRAAFFPQQVLRPGASVAVSLSSGDLTSGGVGTVAYADGDRVWAFGHPLDGVGRRSIFLQDAYVYAIVNNPIGAGDTNTYKLASPGHDVGTLTNDAPSAIAGRLGALPASYPMRVISRDLDTNRQEVITMQVADENAVGLPTGISSLAQVGPVAIAQAAYTILRGSPTRQSGEMCVRVQLRERSKPLRFCNTYVGGGGPGSAGAPAVSDFTEAAGILDSYNLALLHPTRVEVNLKLRRGLRQAFLLGVSGPRFVRRGSRVRLRVRMQRARGARFTRTITVRIPRGIPSGVRDLVLTGTPSDGLGAGGGGGEDDLSQVLTLALDGESGDEAGPKSLSELAKRFAGVHRFDGVRVSFPEPGAEVAEGIEDEGGESLPPGPEGQALKQREAYREPGVRISGAAKMRVFVG